MRMQCYWAVIVDGKLMETGSRLRWIRHERAWNCDGLRVLRDSVSFWRNVAHADVKVQVYDRHRIALR
jgi:hypothetical protein